jgi:hypothetical protein
MILSLRQCHRRVFAVLSVLLPLVFAIGIAARKPIPLRAMPSLAADLRGSETEVWYRSDVFSKIPVGVRLLRGPMSSFHAVGFSVGKGFAKPDLLVYWVAADARVSDVLPDNARLLGGFNSSVHLQISSEDNQSGGQLILYSLADQQVVDVSKPIQFNDSTK